MNWQIILSIFFICSVTSTKVPEYQYQQSSDGPSNETSTSKENTSIRNNNSFKKDDVFDDKDIFDIPNNNDCFSSIDMKKTIVVFLESVKRNPEVLDNLIEKFKFEIDQEPGIFRSNNNVSDNRRSILLQLQLPEQYNPQRLNISSPCAKSITELARSAHKTYMEFKNTPSCMNYLLSENEASVNLDLHAKDTNPDVNTMVAIILKEMGRYDDLKKQTSEITHASVPENNLQNLNLIKQTVSVYPSTADKLIHQNSLAGSPSVNGPFVTDIKHLSGFISQPHTSFIPQTNSNHEVPFSEYNKLETKPEYSQVSKSNLSPLQSFQSIMSTEKSSQMVTQVPHTLASNFYGIKPQEPMSQILEDITTEHPIFGNYQDILKTYPKIFQNDHNELKYNANIPKSIGNERPIRAENVPIHDIGYPVYLEGHSVYSTTQQPLYPDTTRIVPETNIVKLIPELITNKPSANHIKTIRTALIQNNAVFEPNLYKTLLALLDSYEAGLIDNKTMYEIYNFLLQPYNHLWSEEERDIFWNLLQPDETGLINQRNIDLIISLIHSKDHGSLDKPKEFLPLSMVTEQERTYPSNVERIVRLLNQNTTGTLTPDQENILLSLMESAKNDKNNSKYINIANTLSKWDAVLDITDENINVMFSLLKPNFEGHIDPRAVEIINEIILQKKQNILTTNDIEHILSFLKPDANKDVTSKRYGIVAFILNNIEQSPQLRNSIIQLLDNDVIKSKYVDILLALHGERILSVQLIEALITLLKQERNGYIDDHIINKIFTLLAPYKNAHPKMVSDIVKQLRTIRSPNYESASEDFNTNAITMPDNTNLWLYNKPNVNTQHLQGISAPQNRQTRIEYNPSIQKPTSNNNLLLKLLQMPLRDSGTYTATMNRYRFLELTYMINNQIPIYRPVYYVKYRIPVDTFLTSLKTQDPEISANPTMLLQKLVTVGNISEVSPTLKGLNKDDILKLTFKEGDLVQAKLLDKPITNLNDQIKMVHNLNADITPQEILEQNNRNAAQFFHQIGGHVAGRPNLDYLKHMHSITNYAVPPQIVVKNPASSYVLH